MSVLGIALVAIVILTQLYSSVICLGCFTLLGISFFLYDVQRLYGLYVLQGVIPLKKGILPKIASLQVFNIADARKG